MKKLLFTLIANILLVTALFAQAPEKMNYQAVARDLSGLPLVTIAVNLQFDVLQGSATGAVTYSETQSKTTNQFGLFTAEIGAGTVVSGSFPAIAWGTNAYFLRITVNGDVMPATQLLSVPYALYSKTSGGAGTGLIAGSGIDITGGVVTATSDTSATNEFQTLTTNTTNDTVFLSNNGGFVYVPAITGDDWGTDTVVSLGANLLGQGTTVSPLMVIDNDTSATNELQNLSWNTADSNIINLSNGTGLQLASNTPIANQVLTWNGANWVAQTLTTSPWTLTGANIHQTVLTNNVGIGLAAPLFPLHVRTTTNARGAYFETDGTTNAGNKIGVTGISTNGAGTGINKGGAFNAIGGNGGDNYGVDAQAINGIANQRAVNALTSGGTGTNYGVYSSATGGATNWAGYFAAGNVYIADNVGIGTLTPTAKIHSDGTLRLENLGGTAPAAGKVLTSIDANGNAQWIAPSAAPASPWTLTGASIHQTTLANNVGIGTSTPSFPIEINKNQAGTVPFLGIVNTNATGDAPMLFSTTTGNFMMGADGNTFKIASSTTNLALNTRMVIGSTGNVGFGVTAPGARLHADGFGGQALRAQNSSATTATTNLINFGGGPALTVTNGTVGIGISAPTARLHLNSTLRLENLGGTAPAAGTVLTAIDANGNAQWQTPSAAASPWTQGTGVIYNTLLVNNVGVGTNTPSTKLDVLGGVNILHLAGNPLVIRSATDGFGFRVRESDNGNDAVNIFGYASRGRIIINDAGTANINLDANSTLPSYINAGNFGVGLIAPAHKLDVLGGINTSTAYHIANTIVLEKKSSSILVGTTGNTVLTGVDNTIIGDNSGQLMTSGSENTLLGKFSGNANTSGSQNVAIGGLSSQLNQLGWSNVAVGYQALNSNTTSGNTGVGYRAMHFNTTGIQNVALGYLALVSNISADRNTSIGYLSLENTTGANNTGLGYSAGNVNTTGTNNTFIGNNANALAGSTGLTNATAIGSNAVVSQSNSLILGNNANVGIGTSAPNTQLDVAEDIAFRELVTTTTTNAISNMAGTAGTSFINFTSQTSNFSIFSIADGVDGKILRLYNSTSFNMTVANDTGNANSILTMSGGNISTVGTGVITLQYSANQARWIVVSIVQ